MFDPRMPYKFRALWRAFGRKPFSILDVGAGNHSASLTKRWFPNCRYTGIDRSRDYNNDECDFVAMDEFFELDLTTLQFDAIPNRAYDAILIAHVIEHLPNGHEVVLGLLPKLGPGGLVYLEFPGKRSLKLPSMRGTLNFYDDPTHVRLYTAAEVAGWLREQRLEVLCAGTRRDPLGILLLPLHALRCYQAHGFVPGGVFWDLTGFADRVVARQP